SLPSSPYLLFAGTLRRVPRDLRSFPTRRSSDLAGSLAPRQVRRQVHSVLAVGATLRGRTRALARSRRAARWTTRAEQLIGRQDRSEEHTSELQSPDHLVCRLLLEKKRQHSQVST